METINAHSRSNLQLRLRLQLQLRLRLRLTSRSRNSLRSTSLTRPNSLSKRSLSRGLLPRLTAKLVSHADDRGSPETTAFLDNSLPPDFFKQDLLTLIRLLKLPKWHKRVLEAANVEISRILGALTNLIYRVSYSDDLAPPLPALLLRVYGKNADSLIDRERELAVLEKLLQNNIGPHLLGIFGNGRFEQFLEGFRTLTKEEIRDPHISQMLGRRMKDLHYKIDLDPLCDYENLLPMVWRLTHKWMRLVETMYMPVIGDECLIFMMHFTKFKALVAKYEKWLTAHYDSEKFTDNFKFCHNDTQYGNLLLHNSYTKSSKVDSIHSNDKNLVVIDFEYSGANFPALDLTNHFSEWMADYHDPVRSYFIDESKFPTKDEQLNMINAYVEYEKVPETSNFQSNADFSLHSDPEFQAKKMYNECVLWRGPVQVYWALWGLVLYGSEMIKRQQSHMAESADSVYAISNAIDDMTVSENAIEDDAFTSVDDDFDYLQYSHQKIALFIGDCLGLGIITKDELDQKYIDDVKYLDTTLYEI